MIILAIDLGKFKSVACLFTAPDAEQQFHTVNSNPDQFRKLITLLSPDIVVFETCTAAGWVPARHKSVAAIKPHASF